MFNNLYPLTIFTWSFYASFPFFNLQKWGGAQIEMYHYLMQLLVSMGHIRTGVAHGKLPLPQREKWVNSVFLVMHVTEIALLGFKLEVVHIWELAKDPESAFSKSKLSTKS